MRLSKIITGILLAAPLIAGCSTNTEYRAENNQGSQQEMPIEQKENDKNSSYVAVEIQSLMKTPALYEGKEIQLRGIPTEVLTFGYKENVGFSFGIKGKQKDQIIPTELEESLSGNFVICQKNYAGTYGGLNAAALVQSAHENGLEIKVNGKFGEDGVLYLNNISGFGYNIKP